MTSLGHLFPKHWFKFYTVSYKMNFWRFFATCTPCCITAAAHRNPFWSPWGSNPFPLLCELALCVAQWDCRNNGCRNSGCRNSGCLPRTTAELYSTTTDLFWTGLPIFRRLTAYQSPSINCNVPQRRCLSPQRSSMRQYQTSMDNM